FTEIDGLDFRYGQWTAVDVAALSKEWCNLLVKYTGLIIGLHPDDEEEFAELAAAVTTSAGQPAPAAPAVPAAAPTHAAPAVPAPALSLATAAAPPSLDPVPDTPTPTSADPAAAATDKPEKPKRR